MNVLVCDVQGNDWTFRQKLDIRATPPTAVSVTEPEVEEVTVTIAVVPPLVIDSRYTP